MSSPFSVQESITFEPFTESFSDVWVSLSIIGNLRKGSPIQTQRETHDDLFKLIDAEIKLINKEITPSKTQSSNDDLTPDGGYNVSPSNKTNT